MELIAAAAALLCVLMSASAFRFQRFTLNIARAIASEKGGDKVAGDIKGIQQSMTPPSMRRLEYLGYLLGIAAIVFGSQELGWIWGIAIIGWLLVGRVLVSPIWPLPSTAQCVALAQNEASRGLAAAQSHDVDGAERIYLAVIERLQTVRLSSES